MKLLLRKSIFLYLVPFTFVIFWSVGSIFNKIGLSYTTPFTFLFYRLIIASAFLLLISILTKAPWPKTWLSLWKTIATGLVMQFCYLTIFYYALYNNVSPAIITIILGLQPILTVAILEFILKNRITRYQRIGSILGLIGIFIVVGENLSYGNMTILALTFSIGSLIAITAGSIMQKNNTDMNIITGTAIQLIVSIIPATIFNIFLGSFILPNDPLFLVSLVWVAIVVSVGAICIYYSLLKRGHLITTTNLFYLVPPVTAILCFFVFDEKLDIYLLVSITLIVAGIIIAEKKKEVAETYYQQTPSAVKNK